MGMLILRQNLSDFVSSLKTSQPVLPHFSPYESVLKSLLLSYYFYAYKSKQGSDFGKIQNSFNRHHTRVIITRS